MHRLRPKLMTVSAVLASLIPILWASGIGSDVMKPIAAPMVGGMITSTIHVLILVPVFFVLMKERALRRGTLQPQAGNKDISAAKGQIYEQDGGDALAKALESLPEKYREILILRDVNHLSITETAQILSLSEANVKTRLSRARLQMRDALASGFGGLWIGRSCEKVQTS